MGMGLLVLDLGGGVDLLVLGLRGEGGEGGGGVRVEGGGEGVDYVEGFGLG